MTIEHSLEVLAVRLDSDNRIRFSEWEITFTDSNLPGVSSKGAGITPLPGNLPAEASPETIKDATTQSIADHLPHLHAYHADNLQYLYSLEQASNRVVLPVNKTPEERRKDMAPLSRRQLLRALNSLDITPEAVEAAIGDDVDGLIDWREATEFERLHPLLVMVADQFSITPEQVDALWEWASEL